MTSSGREVQAAEWRFVGHQRWLVGAILLWSAGVAFARSFRWPGNWAEAQWLLTYELGFVKRGLVGTLLRLLYGPQTPPSQVEWLIAGCSLALVVACLLALALCAWLFVMKSPSPAIAFLLAVAFLHSPYVAMFGNLSGFFDHILLLLTMGACGLVLTGRLGWAGAVLGVCVLIHESILFLGLPVVCLLALIRRWRELEEPTQDRWRSLFHPQIVRAVGWIIGGAVLCFVGLYLFQELWMERAQLRAAITAQLSAFPFLEHMPRDAAMSMTRSFGVYLRMNMDLAIVRFLQADVSLVNMPLLLLFWAYGWFVWLRFRAGGRKLLWLLIAVSVVPLLLHMIAYDAIRIWGYPQGVVFLATCGMAYLLPEQPLAVSLERSSYVAFALCCLALAVVYGCIHVPMLEVARENLSRLWKIGLYTPSFVASGWVCWKVSQSS